MQPSGWSAAASGGKRNFHWRRSADDLGCADQHKHLSVSNSSSGAMKIDVLTRFWSVGGPSTWRINMKEWMTRIAPAFVAWTGGAFLRLDYAICGGPGYHESPLHEPEIVTRAACN